ncbi:MAG: RHS repeat-associated core domain-containing protein [Planctomycetia bacterium]|nr:RHS repeat-associated core domain-containing protein [Planctomycetia bacterium]
MEKDGTGQTTARYTYNPKPTGELISQRRWNGSSWETRIHRYDGLGSTVALTDETGAVTDSYSYDACGNQIATTGTTTNPFRWLGKHGYYWDEELGTYDVRHRPYQPNIARWTSQDPLERFLEQNLYAYCKNSPLNWFDPTGLIGIFMDGLRQPVGARNVVQSLYAKYTGPKLLLVIDIGAGKVILTDERARNMEKAYVAICDAVCKSADLDCAKFPGGVTFPHGQEPVDFIAWSWGAYTAYKVAQTLNLHGCRCTKQCVVTTEARSCLDIVFGAPPTITSVTRTRAWRIVPVSVRFMGLIDTVATGTPEGEGATLTIPPNVEYVATALATGRTALGTVIFGQSRLVPQMGSKTSVTSAVFNLLHEDIGNDISSPGSPGVEGWLRDEAKKNQVPIP